MNPNQMKRFTSRREPISFEIDDDTFYAAPVIPAGAIMDMLKLQQELAGSTDRGRALDVIMQLFAELLMPDSMRLVEKRIRDKENPIDLRTMVDVIRWLMGEAYGLRPTRLPSSSPEQSEETAGDTSTDGAPPEASNPETSPGTDSST